MLFILLIPVLVFGWGLLQGRRNRREGWLRLVLFGASTLGFLLYFGIFLSGALDGFTHHGGDSFAWGPHWEVTFILLGLTGWWTIAVGCMLLLFNIYLLIKWLCSDGK